MKHDRKAEAKVKIDQLLDEYYFDVQCVPGSMTQETLTRLITRIIVSLCSAWWSIKELMEYAQERQNFKESAYDAGPLS